MPALATRLTTGAAPGSAESVSAHRICARLATEFLGVPVGTIDRYVSDVWMCAAHLGIDPTPPVVERVAREHLLALVNSTPGPPGLPHTPR
jgi:hypothetical protein